MFPNKFIVMVTYQTCTINSQVVSLLDVGLVEHELVVFELILTANRNQIELILKVLLNQGFWLVEVALSPVTSLRLRTRVLNLVGLHSFDSPTLSAPATSGRSPPRGIVSIVEVIKVVEHQIHVLALLILKVVDNSLVLLHLYPDMGVSLPRDSPWFDEIAARSLFLGQLILHVVSALSRRDILNHPIWSVINIILLSPVHRLVIEIPRLLVQLVIRDVEGIPPEAMVT